MPRPCALFGIDYCIRSIPSLPGYTLVIFARGHLVGIKLSSCNRTMSPIFAFLDEVCHLVNLLRLAKYSVDHLCQKCLVSVWHRFQRRWSEICWNDAGGSGKDSNGRPIRKWPGVSASIPSPSQGSGVSGLELRQASTCVSMVLSSSNVSLASPVIRLKCVFMLFTVDSHKPPK